jgi:hypothetical protein
MGQRLNINGIFRLCGGKFFWYLSPGSMEQNTQRTSSTDVMGSQGCKAAEKTQKTNWLNFLQPGSSFSGGCWDYNARRSLQDRTLTTQNHRLREGAKR